jgi:hypothetical protein
MSAFTSTPLTQAASGTVTGRLGGSMAPAGGDSRMPVAADLLKVTGNFQLEERASGCSDCTPSLPVCSKFKFELQTS